MTVLVISLHIQHEHVTNKVLESSILCQAALCSDDQVFHHVHVVHAACVTTLVLVCETVMYGNTPPQAVPGPALRTVSKHDPEVLAAVQRTRREVSNTLGHGPDRPLRERPEFYHTG